MDYTVALIDLDFFLIFILIYPILFLATVKIQFDTRKIGAELLKLRIICKSYRMLTRI